MGPRVGRPACVGRAGRAALFPSARRGWAALRPPHPRLAPKSWRGRAAWAAYPNCSWRPSRRRQRRPPRTRRSCPSPRPCARPAAHVHHLPRLSSLPARPQLSAGAFGFSVAFRISVARCGPGKCALVAVGSSPPWPSGARQGLGFVAGSVSLTCFLPSQGSDKNQVCSPGLLWRHLIRHAVGAQ